MRRVSAVFKRPIVDLRVIVASFVRCEEKGRMNPASANLTIEEQFEF